MKALFGLPLALSLTLIVLLTTANAMATTTNAQNGVLPAQTKPYLQKLLGHYTVTHNSLWSQQQGVVAIKFDSQGRLRLQTNFDLVGDSCGTQVGEVSQVRYYPRGDGGVDAGASIGAWFKISSKCPVEVPFVHVSFNKTLFGADVFRADITLSEGQAGPQGNTGHSEVQWVLSPR